MTSSKTRSDEAKNSGPSKRTIEIDSSPGRLASAVISSIVIPVERERLRKAKIAATSIPMPTAMMRSKEIVISAVMRKPNASARVENMIARAQPGTRALVIGGGLLGLEAACGLAARGMDTGVVHLGEHVLEHFVEAKTAEWREYNGTIHTWELERYLDLI